MTEPDVFYGNQTNVRKLRHSGSFQVLLETRKNFFVNFQSDAGGSDLTELP